MAGWDMWEQLVTSSFLSVVINVLLFSLHGCLFEDKKWSFWFVNHLLACNF